MDEKLKTLDQFGMIGELDGNGFLKVNLRFGKVGVLPHKGSEINDTLPPDDLFNVLVQPDELFKPESMQTLEGLSLTAYAHGWDLPGDDASVDVGSVAGSPYVDGKYLAGKALIKDPLIIKEIQDRNLIEISCGMTQEMDMTPGVYEEQEYVAIRRTIAYNHVTLLPPGQGRNGAEVRVTDELKKKEIIMDKADIVIRYDTPNGAVSVTDSDLKIVKAICDTLKHTETENKRITDELANLSETVAKVQELTAQIDTLTAERDEARGSLEAAKAELEQAMNPELIQEAAAEMTEMAEVAESVDVKDSLPEDWKKGSLPEMKKALVTAWMTKTGKTMDSKATDGYVKGVYAVMKDIKPTVKTVPVSKVVDANTTPPVRTRHAVVGFRKESK